MLTRRFVLFSAGSFVVGGTVVPFLAKNGRQAHAGGKIFPISLSDEMWRERLTPRQYAVLRQHGTEYPYSSPLNEEERRGTFLCAGCGAELFASTAKYDSRTGWPSFWMPINKNAVGESRDTSYGMIRTEIHCARCGGHLGHVFSDGPPPTGLRYCMNGDAMIFEPHDS